MFTALWAQVLFAAFAFTLIGKIVYIKKKTHTRVLDIKGPVGVNPAVKHIGTTAALHQKHTSTWKR